MPDESGGDRVTAWAVPPESPGQFAAERVSICGHRLCYRRGGSGPVLLLLHGIGDSSRTWIPAMGLLQRGCTVLAPDLPGHGDSSNPLGDYSLGSHASSMRDLLDVLSIERVTVVGQSFGGGVAMQFAYQFPGRCERLVLVDAGGLGREVSWILRLATVPAAEYVMPALFPAFVRRWGDPVARFLRDWGIGNARAAEVWRSYRSLTDPGNRAAFARTARAVIDPGGQSVSAVNRLSLVALMPTLIVWGDQDKIIPLVHASRAHQAIPGSRLEVIQGAGHAPHADDPARFAEILEDFLTITEPFRFDPEQMRDLLRRNTAAP
jgi:pimeloyl-ACP methyl ester carboxylesterase